VTLTYYLLQAAKELCFLCKYLHFGSYYVFYAVCYMFRAAPLDPVRDFKSKKQYFVDLEPQNVSLGLIMLVKSLTGLTRKQSCAKLDNQVKKYLHNSICFH